MRRPIVHLVLLFPALWAASMLRADDWARESREMANSRGTHISREPTWAATCREIAVEQARSGDIAEAKRTAAAIAYEPSRSAAYGAIAVIQAWDAVARRSDVAEAKRTAEQIGYRPYKLAAYREIARAQMVSGDVAEAKRTAAHISP